VAIQPRPRSKRGPIAWCLEIHDLVLSKCAAGRERDWEFAREALAAGLVSGDALLSRAADLPLAPPTLDLVLSSLRSLVAADGQR
jgi:hypothetical protein